MTLNFLQSQLFSSFKFRRVRLSWVWSLNKRVNYYCESNNCCESNDCYEWSKNCCEWSKNCCEWSKNCCEESKNCCEELFKFCDESSKLDWESNDFFEVESSVDSVFAIFCLIIFFKALIKICIIMLDLSALKFKKVDIFFLSWE